MISDRQTYGLSALLTISIFLIVSMHGNASKEDIEYTTGKKNLVLNVKSLFPPSAEITLEMPINITNDGRYTYKDVEVELKIYDNDTGNLVGYGVTDLGNIERGSHFSANIVVGLDETKVLYYLFTNTTFRFEGEAKGRYLFFSDSYSFIFYDNWTGPYA